MALQQAQHEREVRLKESEREAAARYVDQFAKRHHWDEESLAEVKGALGI